MKSAAQQNATNVGPRGVAWESRQASVNASVYGGDGSGPMTDTAEDLPITSRYIGCSSYL